MADSRKDSPIAPRRSLGGPILPPPPPELVEEEKAKSDQARTREAEAQRSAQRQADKQAEKQAAKTRKAEERSQQKAARSRPPARPAAPAPTSGKQAPRRSRRAQLRLVQIDAWSVMKTSFLLSIALGIVLVVAVAIIWAVLGAAGVWDSINSIVQQAVGSDNGTPFDIQDYAGTSRVLGFTMIVAVIDVILITAIATLGAFLYNLAAALLGGIEVTLAEDS
jgi:hypothetical protein